MAFTWQGRTYSSKKFPVLETIFGLKTDNRTQRIGENIHFTLGDVSRAYRACGISEPASISNTILDLTRKDRGIDARLPRSIIDCGYDLRKKTGAASNREHFAGEFVYVGLGNSLESWLEWPNVPDRSITIDNRVPPKISQLLSDDEGALFSVIDYCDALSYAMFGSADTVLRVQNPMKWQPNEIDGLYFSDHDAGRQRLYPIEGKALSTGDDVNLEQMLGAYLTMKSRYPGMDIIPLGIQMVGTGLRVAQLTYTGDRLRLDTYIFVRINPAIQSWLGRGAVAEQMPPML